MTVKDFIEQLQKEELTKELNFSGLDFYRLKDRGNFVQIEFSQTVYKNETGKVIVENN